MFESNHKEENLTNEQKILRAVLRGEINFEKVGKDLAIYYPDLFLMVLGANNDHKIKELLNAGQRVAAIKLYREISGVGLKQAKDYCDNMVPPTPLANQQLNSILSSQAYSTSISTTNNIMRGV